MDRPWPDDPRRKVLDAVVEERDLLLPLPETPFPTDERMARLCRNFLEAPTSRVTINEWAQDLGMSRRTFTRRFQQETGVSLSLWRQQASLFAAWPRRTEVGNAQQCAGLQQAVAEKIRQEAARKRQGRGRFCSEHGSESAGGRRSPAEWGYQTLFTAAVAALPSGFPETGLLSSLL